MRVEFESKVYDGGMSVRELHDELAKVIDKGAWERVSCS